MWGFSAKASFWYSSVNCADTRWRYLRYARAPATCRQLSPAKITSRFSESDSASPRQTAAIVSRDALGGRVQLEHRAARVQHAEVVDVDLPLALERGRDLLHGAQAERLEDRHERRQVDLAAGLVELHAREALALALVADPDEEPLGVRLQLLQREHVVDDQPPLVAGLVVVREPRPAYFSASTSPRSAPTRATRASCRSSSHVRASRSTSCSSSSYGTSGICTPGSTCTVKKMLRALGLAERQVVVDRRAVEPLDEQLLEPLAQRGVEPVAGQRHHDAHAAPVEIATDEHADPPVLLELQQAHDQPAQLLRSTPGTARPCGNDSKSSTASL